MKQIQKIYLLLVLTFLAFACKEKQDQQVPADVLPRPADTLPERPREIAPNAYASVDISPMDMSYFPVEYPKLKMANVKIAPPVARVVYSRPQLTKRALFNDILKYNEPWRLGANEASEISFYKTVTIQGKKINPGRYTIYGIPQPDKWIIILNTNIDTWGLKQDTSKDVARFEIPIVTNGTSLEYFTMVFEKTEVGANLVIAWADVVARLPIEFNS